MAASVVLQCNISGSSSSLYPTWVEDTCLPEILKTILKMFKIVFLTFPSPPAIASSTSLDDDLLTLCLSGTRNPELMFCVLFIPALFIFFCTGHPPSHAIVVSCLSTMEELSLRDLQRRFIIKTGYLTN